MLCVIAIFNIAIEKLQLMRSSTSFLFIMLPKGEVTPRMIRREGMVSKMKISV